MRLTPLLVLTCCSLPLSAQETQPEQIDLDPFEGGAEPLPPGSMPSTLQLRLETGYQHVFQADLDDSSTDVEVDRWSTTAGLTGRISRDVRWGVDVSYEASWYDFGNFSSFIPGESSPLDRGDELNFGGRMIFIHDRQWSWLVGGSLTFAAADGADWSEALTGGGFGAARYSFDDRLSMTFGLGVRSRLEEDVFVIPVLGFEWQATDTLRVETQGLGLQITTELNRDLDFSVSGGFERREYRLDTDGVIGDGVLRDSRLPIEAAFEWKPTDKVRVKFGGGVLAWQRFRVDDSGGTKIREEDGDPAGFIGVSAEIRF